MNNCHIQPLFPTPLGIFDLSSEIDQKEIDSLIQFGESADNMKPNLYQNVSSKDTYLLNDKCNLKLKISIQKYLEYYAHQVLRYEDCVDFYITQAWLNTNSKGTSHHKHLHPNSIISGVFYLQTDDKSGNIKFYNKHDSHNTIQAACVSDNEFTYDWYSINPKKYSLVLFPSTLEHSVDVNDSLRNRISLSFNTFVRGRLSTHKEVDTLTELILK
jgi:uncharacterized protein (TIGR02466 family)